uniref:Uncharacterized protein n=1 Tax=Anguilla anguilla TaxID=7936 RepID=A0A0E9XJA8_ANGAN
MGGHQNERDPKPTPPGGQRECHGPSGVPKNLEE